MASDREDAKSSIVERSASDPELQETLTSAHRLQLAITQEANRHTEAMRGWFARGLGPADTAPTMIAFIGMLSGLVVAVTCLIGARNAAADAMQFWGQWAERSLGFAASCIAFIFGKNLKS